jgi:hypothetical protein
MALGAEINAAALFWTAFSLQNNEHFAKTGSGQTWETLSRNGFSAAHVFSPAFRPMHFAPVEQVRHRLSVAMPFYTKNDRLTKTGSGQT